MWIHEVRPVDDGIRIEDHEIGDLPDIDRAAAGKSQPAGRQAGHLVNGGGQIEQPVFAAVLAEYPGKGPVVPGMGPGLAQWAIVRRGSTVRRDHDERMGQHGTDLLLAHAKPHHAHAPVLRDEEFPDELERVLPAARHDLRNPSSHVVLVFRPADRRDHHGAPVSQHVDFLDGRLFHQGQCFRCLQPAQKRLGAAGPEPGWKQVLQRRRVGDVGIPVQGDVHPFPDSPFNHFEGHRDLIPVAPAGGFEVGDLQGDFGLPCGADRFAYGLYEVVVLVSHVGGVKTAIPRRHTAEFGDFILVGETSGRIFKPGGETPGPLRHGLVHKRRHGIDLPRTGRDVFVSDHISANGALSRKRYEVDPDALLFQRVEQAREVRPTDIHAVPPAVTFPQRIEPIFGQGCQR